MKTEIAKLLEERHLPEILKMNNGSEVTRENFPERRREMLDILAEYEYGTMPSPIGETTWKEETKFEVCCGKASESRISITFPTPDGESFTFPVNLIVPKTATAENKLPAVVYLAFENKYYYPIEEVIDSGVIVAEVQYQQVSLDAAGTFDKLMDSHYFENGKRNGGDFGKIGMWAYAASRTLDFLLTLDYVDKSRVGVMGHSRLGKTALWAGANDERFTYIFSNDAGCSGDAIERGKIGERFPRIFTVLGYWFCENMKSVSESTDDAEKSRSISISSWLAALRESCTLPRLLLMNGRTRHRSTSHARQLLRLGSCSAARDSFIRTDFRQRETDSRRGT